MKTRFFITRFTRFLTGLTILASLIGCGQGSLYQVGVESTLMIDSSREELYTPQKGDKRELMVKFWYPAVPLPDAVPLSHWYHTKQDPIAFSPLNPYYEGILDLVNDYGLNQSYLSAPMKSSEGKFPVILYSHGYGNSLEGNQILLEELANNGYFVVAIGHPYESSLLTLSNGRRVSFTPHVQKDMGRLREDPDPDKMLTPKDQEYLENKKPGESISPELFEKVYYYAQNQIGIQEHLDTWVKDSQFVLDQLELMNTGEIPSAFQGKLDLSRVGAIGYSFGGATAGRFCNLDQRCDAGINLDGLQFLRKNESMKKPHLKVQRKKEIQRSSQYADVDHLVLPLITKEDLYIVEVKEARHLDFQDFKLSPDRSGISSEDMQIILKVGALGFFDQYVKKEVSWYSESLLNRFLEVKDYLQVTYSNTSITSLEDLIQVQVEKEN